MNRCAMLSFAAVSRDSSNCCNAALLFAIFEDSEVFELFEVFGSSFCSFVSSTLFLFSSLDSSELDAEAEVDDVDEMET